MSARDVAEIAYIPGMDEGDVDWIYVIIENLNLSGFEGVDDEGEDEEGVTI